MSVNVSLPRDAVQLTVILRWCCTDSLVYTGTNRILMEHLSVQL